MTRQTSAKSLLRIMTIRHSMQVEGTTHPHPSVVNATKQLVDKLFTLNPEEAIGIAVFEENPLHARYIVARTGEVLAEIAIDDD
jgi:hypothetical protein